MLHFVFRLPFDKRERQPENVLTTRFQVASAYTYDSIAHSPRSSKNTDNVSVIAL